MKLLRPQSSLADQIYDAIVDEICDGALASGAHLVQEQLAERLGVSRQPVQQAMTRLKADGIVEEIGTRGLRVTPLDPDLVRHHYDIRAALDGLAARMAAERAGETAGAAEAVAAKGHEILRRGESAVAAGAVDDQVSHDIALHELFYEASGNPLLARTAAPHWRFLRRAMADVLRQAFLPEEIWRQHAEILGAIVAGDPERAERLAVSHDKKASETLCAALARRGDR